MIPIKSKHLFVLIAENGINMSDEITKTLHRAKFINYEVKKMNLFDAPPGSFLIHAVNCKGVWGSGIAALFREKFPNAYAAYKLQCKSGYAAVGKFGGCMYVGWLFTSDGYGTRRDSVDMILNNTRQSVISLLEEMPDSAVIYSNKFNSGLFGVPWEKTEAILLDCLENHNPNGVKWVVCDWD